MGIAPFSRYSCDGGKTIVNVNPNPKLFKILYIDDRFKPYVLAKVHYPTCVNFDGIKLLVFKDINCKDLKSRLTLDPHFSKDDMSPIARFSPTDEGVDLCIEFLKRMSKKKGKKWKIK